MRKRSQGDKGARKSLLFIVILPFALLLYSGNSYSEPQPKITITPKQVNLGMMKKNEAKFYRVIVENGGKGDLYINNIEAPNEKTGIPLNKNAIKSGKKVELTFFYRAVTAGKISDYVSINSNDPLNPSIKILLKGEVK